MVKPSPLSHAATALSWAAVGPKLFANSPAFSHGHRSAAERGGGEAPKPVGVHREVWSYETAGGSSGPAS